MAVAPKVPTNTVEKQSLKRWKKCTNSWEGYRKFHLQATLRMVLTSFATSINVNVLKTTIFSSFATLPWIRNDHKRTAPYRRRHHGLIDFQQMQNLCAIYAMLPSFLKDFSVFLMFQSVSICFNLGLFLPMGVAPSELLHLGLCSPRALQQAGRGALRSVPDDADALSKSQSEKVWSYRKTTEKNTESMGDRRIIGIT